MSGPSRDDAVLYEPERRLVHAAPIPHSVTPARSLMRWEYLHLNPATTALCADCWPSEPLGDDQQWTRAMPAADPIADADIDRVVDAWRSSTPGEWYATEAFDPSDPDTAYGVAVGDPSSDDYRMVVLTAGGGSFVVEDTPRIDDTEAIAVVHNALPALVARIKASEGRPWLPPADPDRPCEHRDFRAIVEVNRLMSEDDGPVTGYSAEVRVWCVECDEPFRFICADAGMLPDRPTVSLDEAELRAPIRPASSDADFGLGIPGFKVRYREAEGET